MNDTSPKRDPRKKTNPPPRECGTRSMDYGSQGYPCDLEAGHKGPHRCMDKDDCPHYYESGY